VQNSIRHRANLDRMEKVIKRSWKLTTSSVAVGLTLAIWSTPSFAIGTLSSARGSGRPQQPLDERNEIVFADSLEDWEGR
jgi:hypothetical protein